MKISKGDFTAVCVFFAATIGTFLNVEASLIWAYLHGRGGLLEIFLTGCFAILLVLLFRTMLTFFDLYL